MWIFDAHFFARIVEGGGADIKQKFFQLLEILNLAAGGKFENKRFSLEIFEGIACRGILSGRRTSIDLDRFTDAFELRHSERVNFDRLIRYDHLQRFDGFLLRSLFFAGRSILYNQCRPAGGGHLIMKGLVLVEINDQQIFALFLYPAAAARQKTYHPCHDRIKR